MRTRRRDISLTLALCLSLTVHAWIVQAAASRYARAYQQFYLPGLAEPARLVQVRAVTPVQALPDPTARLGDADGLPTADALAASPGEQPMQARLAHQTQAHLSLDEQGAGRGGDAAQLGAAGQAAPSGPPETQAPPTAAFSNVAAAENPEFRVPRDDTETAQPVLRQRPAMVAMGIPPETSTAQPESPSDALRPADSPRVPRSDDQTATLPPAPSAPAAVASPASPAAVAPPGAASAADPAPRAESESDAFSIDASAEFTSGRTVARVGRKHRLVRPKLEMAGHADLYSMRPPVTVVLRLHLTATGDVEKVEIIRSSGSINIDQPTRLAAYRWWFEPAKDASGRSKPEVIRFTCRFL